MIQRIQSVYLFLAAMLMLATLFLPAMKVYQYEDVELLTGMSSITLGLFSLGTYSCIPGFVPPALALIAGIMALITIFLYKKRKLQIKFCHCVVILILLFFTSIGYIWWSAKANFDVFLNSIVVTSFPVFASILVSAAIRGIKKDEKLVKSLDRLR